MKLTNVHAFGDVFDLSVIRADGGKLKIDVVREGKPTVSTMLGENGTLVPPTTGSL